MYSFLYIILQFPRKAVTIGLYFKTRVCHGWQVVILSLIVLSPNTQVKNDTTLKVNELGQ
jgi:hypothetical protein